MRGDIGGVVITDTADFTTHDLFSDFLCFCFEYLDL